VKCSSVTDAAGFTGRIFSGGLFQFKNFSDVRSSLYHSRIAGLGIVVAGQCGESYGSSFVLVDFIEALILSAATEDGYFTFFNASTIARRTNSCV
jgi:hypothetical protein